MDAQLDSNFTCEDHRNSLIKGLKPYQILSLSIPARGPGPAGVDVWTDRCSAYDIIFYAYVSLMAILFLCLGLLSTLLLIKRNWARLQSKLFFIVYICIIILGYSRAAWLVLDPFGLIGFIAGGFPGWFVISRIIEALGFPSLVASYTLIIVTLLKISTMPGHQWYEKWRLTLPLLLTPYIIVFAAEIVALTVPYPGVISVVVCEFLFMGWGLTVCLLFFYAGSRLLRKVKKRLKSFKISEVRVNDQQEIARREEFANSELKRREISFKRTTDKITRITYATVVFTMLYALMTSGRAVLTCLLLYNFCLGYEGQRAPSSAWLALEIGQRVNEVCLALILLYSITDISLLTTLCTKQAKSSSTGQNTPN